MASIERESRTIALIHNTALPHPLGVLSTQISSYAERVHFRPFLPDNLRVEIIDIAEFDLLGRDPKATDLDPSPTPSEAKKSVQDWIEEISRHSGFIFLFPYHTWAHCTPLKAAIALLPQHVLTKRPAILTGFGKEEEPPTVEQQGRTWKRKSFGMMRVFLEDKKMNVVEIPGRQPEYTIYADYWPDWVTGGYNGFIGGQQQELWENTVRKPCCGAVAVMVRNIQGAR